MRISKSWQFTAGARAGFGHEKHDSELHATSPAYRAGYYWAKQKGVKQQQDAHVKSIRHES